MAKVAGTRGIKEAVTANPAVFGWPGFLPAFETGAPAPHIAAYNHGVECAADGLFDEAIASYQEAIARKSDFPDAHYNLGLALGRKGKLEEATSVLQKAISIAPGDADFRDAVGWLYVERRLLIEARDAFLMAVHLNPNHQRAWFHLAASYEANNQLDEAVGALDKASSIARASKDTDFQGFILSFAVHLCKLLRDGYNGPNMGETARDLNALADNLGYTSFEQAKIALERGAPKPARDNTTRATELSRPKGEDHKGADAKPRPDWVKARARGVKLSDFLEERFKAELANGQMHRGLLSQYTELQGDFYSLRRSKEFPEQLRNIPKLSDWNTHQLAAGKAKQASAVRPRTEEQRLYEVELGRRRRDRHPARAPA